MNRAEILAAVRLMQDAGHGYTRLPNDVILRLIGEPGYRSSGSWLHGEPATGLEPTPFEPAPADEDVAPFGQYIPRKKRPRPGRP